MGNLHLAASPYLLRLAAFLAICVLAIWLVLMVVSLGLGTTQAPTPAIQGWAFWLLWGTVAAMILHRAGVMFLGLMTRLGLN